MVSIQIKSNTNSEGMLDLHVATGIPESEVDVVLVVHATESEHGRSWPEGFLEQIVGSIDDPTFTRPLQGEYERREALG